MATTADSRAKLATTTIALHWIIAIGMIAMLAAGLWLEQAPRGAFKDSVRWVHKATGVTLLLLILWRVVWRLRQGFPEHVGHYAKWETTLAKLVHWLLLIGTLALPLSGILWSMAAGKPIDIWGLFEIQPLIEKSRPLNDFAKTVHALGGKILIAAIILHAAGALKHHFVDKDGTLRRMAGRRVDAA